ncbi:bifunctional diguanylate cyclase/phosphodiesterase [Vreelandella neptunia]|uniref:EAL domain-containing protein n=2 Tax=Bacteria TaxID=2 RepID=A0ABZ0YJX1_9GAMM|nr:EAL domain-containing protein [Halomonas neptunia]MDN3562374.1 EAL domain-containing protein [Halomonas neptunia]WQH12048.1 EAL domain-containing protein [Halomonas neptunia]
MSATSNDVNDDVLKATKTYRQQRRHVIALYLLALLVMMVLFGWLLSEQYKQEIEAAESRITARANVVAEWAKGVFAQSGQALFGLTELLALQGMTDNEHADELQHSLENLTQYMPMIDEIVILDKEGRVLASGSGRWNADFNISDTTFFNAFKEGSRQEIITPLNLSRSDQRYYLYHGRRFDSSQGDFAGVVISRIVPQVFADSLEQMSVYDGESIALVDSSLKFIARYPIPEEQLSIGTTIDSPETVEWLTRGEPTWSINFDSPIDGRKRLFRMLRVGEYPMLAVVGVDLHELLSAWRQRTLILTLVMAVIALLGAWGARHYLNRLALAHQLRQRIEEREQARAEAQIAAAAFQTHLGILITDPQGIILKVNETFSRITGYSEAEIVGNNPRMFSSGLHNAAFYRRLWKRVIKTGNWEGEIWNQRKNGELFPEWLTISAVYSVEGTLTHYVATMSDISERKAAEQEIHQLAFYDTLTGLANRRLFMDRIGTALKELQRHQRCGALLFIDIDNFKQINDTLGHYAGDQVLQSVARRMGQMLRDTDTLARLGSDEFAVLIEGVDSHHAQTAQLVERIAYKLLAALNEPITLAEESIKVTGSIGIAIMASNEYGVDDYLQQVDMALFQAKSNGRHGVCFFDPSMQAALLAHVKLEADLRQAQASQQWQLYYQPQVDHHGRITGVEALLRWQHPERGMVSPGDFIPLLESNELINDVGEWVLEDACYQLARWAQHPQLRKLTISVNISPLQFRDEHFLARVEGVFARTQAPLQRLKLEVTESLFVEARDDARDKMLALKARGVRFSLDDFGTGYSSLAYLAQLPLDQLKIDQSFVQQVLESQANAAIVESTIALAESLNLEVIAEGVETKAQQAWLLAHDCHAYQGYLFGRPVTAEAIERLITGA